MKVVNLFLNNPYIWNFFRNFLEIFFRIYTTKYLLLKNNIKNNKVADIGCGDGFFSSFFKSSNIKYYGYEINKKYFNFAKKNYKKKNVFFLNSLYNLKKFDGTIIFIDVVHHLSKSKFRYILNIIRKTHFKNIIFFEPYIDKPKLFSQLILKYDRGSYFRNKYELKKLINQNLLKLNKEIVIKNFFFHDSLVLFTTRK